MRRETSAPPRMFEIWDSRLIHADEFWGRTQASMGMTSAYNVSEIPLDKNAPPPAPTRERFRRYWQSYNGVPIENASYVLFTVDGYVRDGRGELVNGLSLSTTPAITHDVAFQAALAHVPADQYAWQEKPFPPAPLGELTIYSPDLGTTKPFRLVWTFDIGTIKPKLDERRVHVDAQTGGVIDAPSRLRHADAPAQGVTQAGASVSFGTTLSAGDYVLQTTTSSMIHTYDGVSETGTREFRDLDNVWTEPENRRGVSVHWASIQTWNWLYSHGWHGPDDSGPFTEGLKTTQIFNQPWCGGSSFFHPGRRLIYLCHLVGPGMPDLDIESIAHEVGHLVQFYRLRDHKGRPVGFSDAVPEARALGEHLADVMGTSVQYAATNVASDWVLFDRSSGGPRSMTNPNSEEAPDTYLGTYWATAFPDKPHALAGVGNRWFVLLSAGGIGATDHGTKYNVTGLGRDTAETIVMVALRWLTASSGYKDYFDATRRAASYLFGAASAEAATVTAAWRAVGISDPVPPVTHWPTPGEERVHPWDTFLKVEVPASLCKTQPCSEAVQWEAEISPDPKFVAIQTKKVTLIKNNDYATGLVELYAATVHYWRVRAKRADGTYTAWRFTADFETRGMAPRDVTPVHGEHEADPWEQDFRWTSPAFAVPPYYHLQIATTPDFAYPANFYPTTPGEYNLVLVSNEQYFWRVRARSPSGTSYGAWSTRHHAKLSGATDDERETPWSEDNTLVFTTRTPRVELYTPKDDERVYPWLLFMSWTPVPGAESYDFEMATDSTFASPTLQVSASDNRRTIHLPVNPDIKHWWRVRAHGPNGETTEWDVGYFFVAPGVTRPSCVSPGTEPVEPNDVTLRWSAVKEAFEYHVDVRDRTTGSSVYYREVDGARTSLDVDPAIAKFKRDRSYEFRVRAYGYNDIPGDLLNACRFEIKDLPPCNTHTEPGGEVSETHTFELGRTEGSVRLNFKTLNIKDNMIVTYEGEEVYRTHCRETPADHSWVTSPEIFFSGTSSEMTVHVDPHCDPYETSDEETIWEFNLSCPQ